MISLYFSWLLAGLLAVPVLVSIEWFVLVKLVTLACPYLRKKRICFLIAHCDDEAMFFSPTVIKFTDSALQNRVELLCLCPGEDPALRRTRTRELYSSAANLGIKSPDYVTVVDDEESFPDHMRISWSAEKISKVLSSRYSANVQTSDRPDIDVIITFDHHGISSHANHISLLHGAKHWIRGLPSDVQNAVSLYSLTTTNIVRKYISIFDAPLSVLLYVFRSASGDHNQPGTAEELDHGPKRLLFFSTFTAYRIAQKSMTDCHKSQMLWFRYGWIMLSRYVSTNDLKREPIG